MGTQAVALFLLLVLLVSGCASDTGNVVETAKMDIQAQNDSVRMNQTPEDIDELHREFAEFENSQPPSNPQPQAQNKTQSNSSQEPKNQSRSGGGGTAQSEQTNITKKCPSSCGDDNPCTKDSCSPGTNYKCVHENVAPCCGNMLCEVTENFTACPEDCPCILECAACEAVDNESCACLLNECGPDDGCCPEGCNHTSDADCPDLDLCQADSDCDDGDSCTKDICAGEPKECFLPPLTECIPDDGCCPSNCAYAEDSDCTRPSVIFSEIYYSLPGTDDNHEWIEVYNNGTVEVDLTKWWLIETEAKSGNHTIKNITNEFAITPGSYAIIADDANQFLLDYPNYSGIIFDSSFSLSNTGEQLDLKIEKAGETTDSLLYNNSWGGDGNGSLEKIDLSGPNTQENWNQSLTEKGTPGERNSISI